MPTQRLLTICREYLDAYASTCDQSSLLIRAAWKVEYALRLTANDFPVLREFLLVQTVGFGSSHQQITGPSWLRADCIGRSALALTQYPLAYQIAWLDAVASQIVPPPDEETCLTGSNAEKLAVRSDVIVSEALRLAKSTRSLRPKVVVVGALGSLIFRLVKNHQIDIRAVDGDEAVIGRNYHGVVVESASLTKELVSGSDVAVVTGMALAIETMDDIVDAAVQSRVKLLLYLQTGANLVEPYLVAGAATVVSEPYPFYFMSSGKSVMRVYRARAYHR